MVFVVHSYPCQPMNQSFLISPLVAVVDFVGTHVAAEAFSAASPRSSPLHRGPRHTHPPHPLLSPALPAIACAPPFLYLMFQSTLHSRACPLSPFTRSFPH